MRLRTKSIRGVTVHNHDGSVRSVSFGTAWGEKLNIKLLVFFSFIKP